MNITEKQKEKLFKKAIRYMETAEFGLSEGYLALSYAFEILGLSDEFYEYEGTH